MKGNGTAGRPGAARADTGGLLSADELLREWDRRHGPHADAWFVGGLALTVLRWVLRLAWWGLRVAARFPLVPGAVAVVALVYLDEGAFALAGLAALVGAGLVWWRVVDQPERRPVAWRVRASWRGWWHYGRRWASVTSLSGLTSTYRGDELVPVLQRVESWPGRDRLTVRLVEGQHPDDYTAVAERLAHAWGALACRARRVVDHRGLPVPGLMWLDFHYTDPLADVVSAFPLPGGQAPADGRAGTSAPAPADVAEGA